MSHIAVEKGYPQPIPSRTDYHVSPNHFDKPPDTVMVTIPKSNHAYLLRLSREYHNLKQALYQGGVSHESLETLINASGISEESQEIADRRGSYDDEPFQPHVSGAQPTVIRGPLHERQLDFDDSFTDEYLPHHQKANGSGFGSCGSYDNSTQKRSGNSHYANHSTTPGHDSSDGTSFPGDENVDPQFPVNGTSKENRHQASHSEQRTVTLRGLSERTTHRDVAAVVRGGTLLDIFLRIRERVASVSFVDGSAAREFLAHAKRHDLYILGKRVEVSWAERQFYLPTHVGVKIYNGASRNLVIRGVNPNITEAMIREDMDHIHNLIIVSVTFERGDCFISTNSVHNALFARTCMMSRLPYKGMKIEYYPDECAAPLPKIQHVPRERHQPPVKKMNPAANRFQMLNLDGTDDGSEEDDEDEDDTTIDSSLSGGMFQGRNGIAI